MKEKILLTITALFFALGNVYRFFSYIISNFSRNGIFSEVDKAYNCLNVISYIGMLGFIAMTIIDIIHLFILLFKLHKE